MARRFVIGFLLLVLSVSLMAQQRFKPTRPRNDAALYERPILGVRGGVSLPWLSFADARLDGLPNDLMVRPSLAAFVEFPLAKICTMAPELGYQVRGGSSTYWYANRYPETYTIKANTVTLRLPVVLYYPVSDRWKPYVFAGPDLGIALGGEIKLSHPENSPLPNHKTKITSYNYRRAFVSAVGGMGVRYNIPLALITLVVKADAALNWGLTDTYSKAEHDQQASPLNVSAYHLNGGRFLRGLEFHLGVGFFINKPDGCGGFRSNCYL